jgi:hypothetical protein
MKDLYRKLGIESGASREAIESALESCPDLADDHAPVLLDPEKREVYDEAHAALKAIGGEGAQKVLAEMREACADDPEIVAAFCQMVEERSREGAVLPSLANSTQSVR